MARPRAGGRRHPARVGAHDVRLRRTAATTNGARAGPAAHRHARLRLRILPRRARSSRADRASDARMRGTRNRGPMRLSRLGRGAALARLALRIGGRSMAKSPRLIFASVERRRELRHDLALRTADDVVETLGSMKGALMKLGQMASYIDEDMPQTFRAAMARLQRSAPPMSPALASSVIVDELGARLREEVDYVLEAENQELFATYYEGHPVIHVPHVVSELSSARVLTTELVVGASFEDLLGWNQHERDMAAETINRFVSRSLYRLHAFNGDPHPGNYLFHGRGRVSFLDFGLTKHFSAEDLEPLADAVRYLVIENDGELFRASLERAGFLRPGAPVPTEAVVDRFGLFYATVRRDAPMTITPAYASAIVRRFFDARGPLAPYSDVPRAYVVLQRINLGLYAVLGSLRATANWRRIAEEIWPFVNAPPSTPIGEAEAEWEQGRKGRLSALDRSA